MVDASTAGRLPRWVLIALAAVAAVAVAFAIGRFTAFGATAVPASPGTQSADAGFARDMQMHHAQAVEMAMEIYRKTDDAEVRVLAYDMATAQSAQIGEMYSWLVDWNLPQLGDPLMRWMSGGSATNGHSHGGDAASSRPATVEELHAGMGMASGPQMKQLAELSGTEADCLFLTLMTRHHVGGIEMVDAILDLGSQPRVKTVAAAMGEAQQFEIDAMNASLLRLGCS